MEKAMRLNNLKIRTKLVIIYILCVILPLIATDSFLYLSVKKSVEKDQMNVIKDMGRRIEYDMDKMIQNVVSVSDYLYANKELNEFIEHRYTSKSDYYDHYNLFMSDNLLRYYYTALSISKIQICGENETITDGGYFIRKAEIENKEWYQKFLKNNSQTFFSVYYDNTNYYEAYTGQARHMSFIRKMDYFGGNHIMKLDIDYQEVIQTFKNERNVDIYIYDNEKIIYTTVKNEGENQNFLSLSGLEAKEVEYKKTITILGNTTWNIYITADKYSIINGLKEQWYFIIVVFMLNLILPSIVIVLMNRSFHNRITLTEQYIKKIENEEFEEIVCSEGRDEIGNLIRSYNFMVIKIKELIEVVYKKNVQQQTLEISRKDAELHALQSQMNPHFLFNTLESIRMHSFLKREKETADVLGKLASLMRTVIQWNKDFVTMKEEEDYIKDYMDIQKYRFGDRLNYSIYIQEECKAWRIPKFGILTFVENACLHGIEKSIKGGSITVMVTKDEQHMYLEIMDSGRGISEYDLRKLRNKIANASMKDLSSSKSIGILNTIIRLNLYYNGNIVFDINSTIGEGTEICITLPLDYNQEMQDN